jgi:hypothetical protein
MPRTVMRTRAISFQPRATLLALLALAGCFLAVAAPAKEQTVDEMKSRLSSTEIQNRPRLCVDIAEKQLAAYDKLYSASDMEKAQSALTDVISFSELARDYSIQSHKREKQTEIAVRNMIRKLNDLKHLVAHEDQAALENAINRLQLVRDDLLLAMFPNAKPK